VWWKPSTDSVYNVAGITTESTLQMQKFVETPGVTYDFYVTTQNDHGTSLPSDVLSVIAADSPTTM
jgi:hypothetical protein